jgi:hypothetical protein
MIKVGHGALHTPNVLVAIVVHVEIREASQHIFKTAPPPEAIGSTLVIIISIRALCMNPTTMIYNCLELLLIIIMSKYFKLVKFCIHSRCDLVAVSKKF